MLSTRCFLLGDMIFCFSVLPDLIVFLLFSFESRFPCLVVRGSYNLKMSCLCLVLGLIIWFIFAFCSSKSFFVLLADPLKDSCLWWWNYLDS